MKYIIVLITICLSFNVGFSQITTFNKRMTLGCGSTILTSLEVTDSCYYATGFARDAISCERSTLFVKYDTIGNVSFYKIVYDTIGDYETWDPSLQTYIDGDLVLSSYYRDSNGMRGGVLKYDLNGNVTWSSLHYNPTTIGSLMRPDDMQVTKDSGYILVNSVAGSSATDLSILKLDKNGNPNWHVTRGVSSYNEHSPCVYVESNSSYVVGYQEDDLSAVQMNYTVRSKLEKVDNGGNTVWTYESPSNEQIHGVNDFIKSKDGGWVVASAWGSEYVWSQFNHQFLKEAYVYKLDSARNFLWGTKFSSDSYLPREHFTKIIELEDSSLVAFGIVERQHPQPNPTHYIIHGRVVKLSPQGDSLWSREYEYLTTASAKHEIYDAERTYDGGFLVCGESNGIGSGVNQQGWLLKLDEHGCLVPGCHIGLGVLPVGSVEQIDLSLYPNPTTDYLNVHYQSIKIGDELTFSVVDMQGRILQAYSTADISDKTYIVPVYDLVVGMYVLELRRDGKLLQSEQFVKE